MSAISLRSSQGKRSLSTPASVSHVSTNMAATVPPDLDAALFAGKPKPAGLSADESRAWDQLSFFYKNGLGYANEMSLRPQTLYGIADSPVGLAAWILDHDDASEKLIARVFAGAREGRRIQNDRRVAAVDASQEFEHVRFAELDIREPV